MSDLKSSSSLSFTIPQGEDWRRDLELYDEDENLIDFTGYTDVTAYYADGYNSASALEMTAAFVDDEDATSATGTSTGKVRLSVTNTASSSIEYTSGYFDVYLTEPSGDRKRLCEGTITSTPKVPAGEA